MTARKKEQPGDYNFARFSELIVKAVARAARRGYVVAQEHDNTCLCPNGAVVLLAWPRLRLSRHDKFEHQYPTCDDAAEAYRALLGGEPRDWMDQARALEVGFDGSNPIKECVSRRDPYYLLGVKYRREAA